MPKFDPNNADWDRIQHAQQPPASGKDKNARGGNDRVRDKSRYDEKFDQIMSKCKNCGKERPMGQKCEECGE